jgi:hypothetical protein
LAKVGVDFVAITCYNIATSEANETEPTSKKESEMQHIKIQAGQTMWEAAEQLGLDTYVQSYGNAKVNQPMAEDVEKWGEPIGTVEVAPYESYYIYNRKS